MEKSIVACAIFMTNSAQKLAICQKFGHIYLDLAIQRKTDFDNLYTK